MFDVDNDKFEHLRIDEDLSVATRTIDVPAYDLDFRAYFPTRTIIQSLEPVLTIGRVGAFQNYARAYDELLKRNVRLIHDPTEHLRASELEHWYATIADLTPMSIWGEGPPSISSIETELGWPVFVKGSRQTHRHKRSLHVAHNPSEYLEIIRRFESDPVLSWQRVVCREFVALRRVDDVETDRMPAAFEFRSFWYKGELVGFGRYWWESCDYRPDRIERDAAIGIACDAAQRLALPFVAIDVGQKQTGEWIVIEVNDAQESGYAGVNRIGMWQAIIDIERNAG